ncbi:VOC family protein [Alteromonas sp. a30]|uniref:VOC family protein n=1 Tax=Alteromonas sp. a30 TaxID=2730917 RepID=UPI00228239DC|nr:VOC family protein [Alteromonas sp. a30]MCY7294722.1 VOC family protein [Alteromonas sp. a30]
MSNALSPFHLAIPVTDIDKADAFYGGLMGCEKGRSSQQWIDWNFYGHQLVTHLVEEMPGVAGYNQVDGKKVPVPHFGIVLPWQQWEELADRFSKHDYPMYIEPYTRFAGKTGEQGTFFLFDPSDNALEFKTFKDMDTLFAS